MKYSNITKGVFISRPNRFVAVVLIDGKKEIVHVKNTGRCKELLVEGCSVFLEKINDRKRKTSFDLVCVEKAVGDGIKILINIITIQQILKDKHLKIIGIFMPKILVICQEKE